LNTSSTLHDAHCHAWENIKAALTEPGRTFYLVTQGCRVNQYESQALREIWTSNGLLETDDPTAADMVFINSCAVTERAVLDLGKLVRGFTALEPRPRIIVAGCAVEADRKRILDLPGVDAVMDQKTKVRRTSALFPDMRISGYKRSRAVIKVQDGCSHGCTYCIIPSTRGPSVSREGREVIAEARRLLASGVREMSLCGINLRQYGRDLSPRRDFWDLLAEVDRALAPEWAGRARLRLGSLEPGDLHAKALDVLGQTRLMSPHLHLSLQSGSPAVLRRMGRGHYNPEGIALFLTELAEIWPIFGLGADIITGFPGETEEHFTQTLDLTSRLPLSYAHVFPYSERPGTPAATFAQAVPGHVRRERAKAVRRIVSKKRRLFLERLLHLPAMQVALEENGSGMNEFYVECAVDGADAARKLEQVVPVGLTPRGLRVRKTEEIS
jgi:MiaB/RimO family radical SAM methylthiotransferase